MIDKFLQMLQDFRDGASSEEERKKYQVAVDLYFFKGKKTAEEFIEKMKGGDN